MKGRIWVGLIFLVASLHAKAQPLLLHSAPKHDLRNQLWHLRDSIHAFSFDEIQRAAGWSKAGSLNYGFDHAAHWFYADINSDSVEHFLLEIAFAPLDRIDFFYPSETGWNHKVSGDGFPISTHDMPYQHPVFKFQLRKGETVRIYLRVESTSSVQVPATIWEPEAFLNRAIHLQIFNGIFYGAMIMMILYQLFLFVSTREKISLYYIFSLFAMTHVVSFFQGYSFLYTYPELPELNKYMAILTGPVFLLFSTGLTRAFLDLKKMYPIIDKLLLANISINILMSLLMLFNLINVSNQVHHYAILVHALLALVAAGYGIYNRFRPALFYLFSWLTLLIAALIFSLSNLGFLHGFFSTSSAMIIACLVQMLFISFALGNRWNILVRESQASREHELQRKELEKERLEEEVRLRTDEIQRQNEKLEDVNRIKDKLFSIVSHDIKGPLTSLQLALALTKNNTISPAEFRELTDSLENRFKQTTEFIENMLQWAKLQLKGESFEPAEVDVSAMAARILSLLEPEIKSKGIAVHNSMAKEIKVFADPNMLGSVIKNLLVNAIKFTGKKGKIEVNASTSGAFVMISVADTGTGIPLINREKIFSLDIVTTPGTRQEKGTGLGLVLCREFVERNGGEIWFQSKEGEGSSFYFTVPSFTP